MSYTKELVSFDYTDKDIAAIVDWGIFLTDGTVIDFAECALNFKTEHPESSCNCVGERDITKYYFEFYTNDKHVCITIPRSGMMDHIFKHRRSDRFRRLQVEIFRRGYNTYDLS